MELLTHLESLVAVIDEQGFTRAAERLGIPQPLISRRIQNLERRWGQPLLDRTAPRPVPTPFAESVLPHVRELLSGAQTLELAVASARDRVIHTIGVPADCPASALAHALAVASGRGVSLAIRELPAQARQDAVEAGELSYALVRTPDHSAALRVEVGLAVDPSRAQPRNGWHLETLRPRRCDAADRVGPVGVLITPEDDLPFQLERLRSELARAGLAPTAITVDAPGPAAARVLSDGAVLLCDRRTARRHGLAWDHLAIRSLDRNYELRIAGIQGGAATAEWMVPLLGQLLGAAQEPVTAQPPDGAPSTTEIEATLRLTASG